jgi:hypothetical protein
MWASRPAKTLGDAVLETGIAGTNFDAHGYGMVRFYLDGKIIQLLGQLVPDESTELRVNAGDRLFICSVDSVRQRCMVSRTAAFSLDPLPDSAQDLDAKPRRDILVYAEWKSALWRHCRRVDAPAFTCTVSN